MHTKNKSIFNLLNKKTSHYKQKFLKRLNKQKLDKDYVYRFLKTTQNFL